MISDVGLVDFLKACSHDHQDLICRLDDDKLAMSTCTSP